MVRDSSFPNALGIPQSYDRRSWPFPKTPMSVLHEYVQARRFAAPLVTTTTVAHGAFLARLCVPEMSDLFYEGRTPSQSKDDARHNAALQFLIDNGLWSMHTAV